MRACVIAAIFVSVQAFAGPGAEGLTGAKELVQKILPDAGSLKDCGNSPEARELARLIMQDTSQQRLRLVCNPLLAKVAEIKAREMSEKGMVTHFASNVGANTRLRQAGYELPDSYPSLYENQVEAVAGGFTTAKDVWDEFKVSPVHRTHLLGELPFFRAQDEIGVAYIHSWESPHVEYWAVYIARQK